MHFYWLVLGILFTWRLTHLLQAEDGPWDLLVRLRRRVGDRLWGRLLDCFNCLSLWLAAPLAYLLGQGLWERLLLWPALSGGAILLQRLTERSPEAPQALYWETLGEQDGVLRREEEDNPPTGPETPAP